MSATTATVQRAGPAWAPRVFLRRLANGDAVAHLITLIFAAAVILITASLFYILWRDSALPRAAFGWNFLFTQTWDPVFEKFGALPFIYGTLMTSFLALLMAVPLGLGAAIFLAELAPARISDGLTFVIELLAAVPSVLYGLLGVFVVVPFVRTVVGPALENSFGVIPFFKGPGYGVSFLTAGLVLSIMIVPFIISVSREILMAVPVDQREAALSLGATRWESTWRVVVPYARSGIFGSIFLALARALGETMAVTMVIGNVPAISASILAPGYSIAAVIANEFTEATGDLYLQALVELGLVLFLLTFILNGMARLLILATTQKGTAHE
ncbi:MAG: phosphate ABC transporter permease subunit PstC [Acidobacteria bacterium]|nr:phosphate ABC transporter permease subunit PstC [Acidobacteriota bacterium]MCL5287095.1 phosphate ABC transporter permease subunit PstC [Acidobacteriota bacterium]